MKRHNIIAKLIGEGFSEKTLSKMSDNDVNMLAERILGEQYGYSYESGNNKDSVVNIPKEKTDQVRSAEQKRKTFVTYENEGEVGEEDVSEEEVSEEEETTEAARTFANQNRPKMPKGTKFKAGRHFSKKESQPFEPLNEQEELKKWVESLVNENYHSMTTKNEIMDVIKGKIMEQEVAPAKPKTRPTTKPNRETTPQKTPYPDPWQPPEPGKVPDPTPKFEEGEGLPEFLKFDNIVMSLNEAKIQKITSLVMDTIDKKKKKVSEQVWKSLKTPDYDDKFRHLLSKISGRLFIGENTKKIENEWRLKYINRLELTPIINSNGYYTVSDEDLPILEKNIDNHTEKIKGTFDKVLNILKPKEKKDEYEPEDEGDGYDDY